MNVGTPVLLLCLAQEGLCGLARRLVPTVGILQAARELRLERLRH